jgi:hypothetical protein
MIQVVGGLGAGLAVMLVLFAWNLSSGPISLAFLSPYIENALSPPDQPLRIRLKDTILTWAGWKRALDIRVIDVRAVDRADVVIASVPELSLSLSAKALVRGRIAPKRIELFRPTLRLLRRRDGGFQVGFGGVAKSQAAVSGQAFSQMISNLDPDSTMSYLTHINIVDAELSMEDRLLDTAWFAPSAQVQLTRDEGGIKGELSFTLLSDDGGAEVAVLGDYRTAARRFDVGINFSQVTPAVFSKISPELNVLDAFDLPLKGTVTLSVSAADGKVEGVGFDLVGGAGHVTAPPPLAQRLPVRKVELRGRFEGKTRLLEIDDLFMDLGKNGRISLPAPTNHDMPVRSLRAKGRFFGNEKRLEVSALEADLGGPKVALSIAAEGLDGTNDQLALGVSGILKNVKVNTVGRIWPKAWGRDAHTWCVKNLSDGVVRQARAEVRLRADGKGGFQVVSLNGDMDLRGFTVDYLSPMPKAVKVDGKATFDKEKFEIDILRGQVTGLTARKGRLIFTGLVERDQFLDIDLSIDGPIPNAVGLIDHKPLGFASTLGINADRTAGNAATRLKLKMMLEHTLTMDRVEVLATSTLTDVAIEKFAGRHTVKDGSLDLRVDKEGMDVKGDIFLGTIPATLIWRENFAAKAPFRSRFDLTGRFGDAQRATELGLTFPPFTTPYLTGEIGAGLRREVYADGRTRLAAKLDLTAAELSVPKVGWAKKPGVKGEAEATWSMQNERITEVSRFAIVAGDLSTEGSVQFAPGGQVNRIDFNRLAYGRTDVKGALIAGQNGGWTASVHGASFDLSPLFDDVLGKASGPAKAEPQQGAKERFSLSADLDTLWLGAERKVNRVAGSLIRMGDQWHGMRLEGEVGEKNRRFSLRIEQSGKSKRRLNIQAGDAGGFLKAFDLYENMAAGQLDIKAEFDDAQPGQPLKGVVTITDYRIIDAPALVRLVGIIGITGILDSLEGEGIGFSKMEVPFTLVDGVLHMEDANAAGAAMGWTASGRIYTHAEIIDVEGTLVPAHAINSVLGYIPVLGPLLTGGETGGGVFAANFKLTGPMEDPEVSVNPLSALTPGILRKVFSIFDTDKNETTKAPPPKN